jgi:hypothetical protein
MVSKRRYPAVALAVAMLGSIPSAGWAGGDEGPILISRYCQNCHEVAPGVEARYPGNPQAPSLVAIGKDRKNYPEARIEAVLKEAPHSKMQPFYFSPEQRLSLVIYIRNLAKP